AGPESTPAAATPAAERALVHSRPNWATGAVPQIDLRPWAPDLSAFPRAAWGASIRSVLRTAPDHELGNHLDLFGAPALRASLAAYLGRSRGVATTADRIVVTCGMTQGVAAVAAALHARGVARIAIEDPGFSVHRLMLESGGLRTIPIPVDGDGLDVDALARSDAEAVLVTPAHQYPRGAVLAPERRTALLAWARERDAFVLEDDYDGEYRYDREPVGALQGLDPDRVIYLGSASKMLAPALRIGWAAVPAGLATEVAMRRAIAGGGSWLDQLALADLIERGELDRHLRRMRPRYRRRRELLLAAIGELLPDARVVGVAAGLSFLLLLPDLDEAAVTAAAGERGIAVWGLGHFWARDGADGARETGLVVGYGALPEAAARRAIGELADVIYEAGPATPPK
ncbi:MAG: PLP-dependent aminotransferase family protein, partial [Solirubrobacteraceae bacterium]|nr:PLP-dependent aminotransferase family protein [Solirubrobacteraceae bacterium]